MEDENLELAEHENQFIIVKGRFKYGKYDDEVGMFMAIVGHEGVKSWNLVMTDNPEFQLTPVDGDYIIFKRIFNDNTIKEKKRSYNFKTQLKEALTDKLKNILTGSNEQIYDFFEQELHLLAKEKVKLDLAIEEVSEEEIRDNFPKLFVTEANQNEEEENDTQNTVIDCSVLIAPINGKKLAQLNIGDEILLVTSESNYNLIAEEIPEKIIEENRLIGKIEEIKYNKEEEKYTFVVMFSSEIFGEAAIDANSNMKLAVPSQEQENDYQEYKHLSNRVINFLLIILLIVFIILIIFNFK